MSRFALTVSLIAALTSAALADRAVDPHTSVSNAGIRFAEPPAHLRIAPDVVVDRAAVRARLAANRAANLARFRAYQRKGVFPNNTYADGKLNVWLDEAGNLCAAATIIQASGQADLVARVADQNNFIRLADVTQGPLMDWILTSGLTQDEIAAIQEPMMRVNRDDLEPVLATVDPGLRRIEDRRLIEKYREVDAKLVKDQHRSLDAAVDRLMAHPRLAQQLLDA